MFCQCFCCMSNNHQLFYKIGNVWRRRRWSNVDIFSRQTKLRLKSNSIISCLPLFLSLPFSHIFTCLPQMMQIDKEEKRESTIFTRFFCYSLALPRMSSSPSQFMQTLFLCLISLSFPFPPLTLNSFILYGSHPLRSSTPPQQQTDQWFNKGRKKLVDLLYDKRNKNNICCKSLFLSFPNIM